MKKRRGPGDQSALFPGFDDVGEIGSGAFASVHRALEADTGRPVALKLLKVGSLPRLLESFQREVRTLAALSSHPNIVTLYRAVASADGRPVLVLELCRGSYAQQVRALGPLDPQAAVAIGVKIAGALETAHRAGFLHRDVKPQNILETQFGEPALADFGVAVLQAAAQSTEGVFGFTTLHAPPEILEGRALTPATDIYGLASTLYQLLTGQAPFTTFDGEAPASVILRILRDPAEPVLAPGVPLALSDLIAAALAKDPAARPETAAEFAEALRHVEAHSGWPVTSYAVWGDGGPRPVTVEASRPAPMPEPAAPPAARGPILLPPPPPPPAGSGSPSLATAAGERRRVLQPERPSPPPSPGPPAPPRPPAAPGAPALAPAPEEPRRVLQPERPTPPPRPEPPAAPGPPAAVPAPRPAPEALPMSRPASSALVVPWGTSMEAPASPAGRPPPDSLAAPPATGATETTTGPPLQAIVAGVGALVVVAVLVVLIVAGVL